MNTRSSTEAEVVATDEIISPMMQTQLFLEALGYPVKKIPYTKTIKVLCCLRPMDTRVQASVFIISISDTSTSPIKKPKVTLTLTIVQPSR